MLVEPRAPDDAHAVAGLQHRPQARARPAPHQAEMAAVRARHHLEDGARLAMAAHAEHDAFVGPFHGGVLSRRLSPQRLLSASGCGFFRCASSLPMTKQAARSTAATAFEARSVKYHKIADLP